MDERDQKALDQIGKVDMDKVGKAEQEREEEIVEALEFLKDFINAWSGDTLNDWEEEFIDSISGFIARGYRLTDNQFEKLLQIKVKYE